MMLKTLLPKNRVVPLRLTVWFALAATFWVDAMEDVGHKHQNINGMNLEPLNYFRKAYNSSPPPPRSRIGTEDMLRQQLAAERIENARRRGKVDPFTTALLAAEQRRSESSSSTGVEDATPTPTEVDAEKEGPRIVSYRAARDLRGAPRRVVVVDMQADAHPSSLQEGFVGPLLNADAPSTPRPTRPHFKSGPIDLGPPPPSNIVDSPLQPEVLREARSHGEPPCDPDPSGAPVSSPEGTAPPHIVLSKLGLLVAPDDASPSSKKHHSGKLPRGGGTAATPPKRKGIESVAAPEKAVPVEVKLVEDSTPRVDTRSTTSSARSTGTATSPASMNSSIASPNEGENSDGGGRSRTASMASSATSTTAVVDLNVRGLDGFGVTVEEPTDHVLTRQHLSGDGRGGLGWDGDGGGGTAVRASEESVPGAQWGAPPGAALLQQAAQSFSSAAQSFSGTARVLQQQQQSFPLQQCHSPGTAESQGGAQQAAPLLQHQQTSLQQRGSPGGLLSESQAALLLHHHQTAQGGGGAPGVAESQAGAQLAALLLQQPAFLQQQQAFCAQGGGGAPGVALSASQAGALQAALLLQQPPVSLQQQQAFCAQGLAPGVAESQAAQQGALLQTSLQQQQASPLPCAPPGAIGSQAAAALLQQQQQAFSSMLEQQQQAFSSMLQQQQHASLQQPGAPGAAPRSEYPQTSLFLQMQQLILQYATAAAANNNLPAFCFFFTQFMQCGVPQVVGTPQPPGASVVGIPPAAGELRTPPAPGGEQVQQGRINGEEPLQPQVAVARESEGRSTGRKSRLGLNGRAGLQNKKLEKHQIAPAVQQQAPVIPQFTGPGNDVFSLLAPNDPHADQLSAPQALEAFLAAGRLFPGSSLEGETFSSHEREQSEVHFEIKRFAEAALIWTVLRGTGYFSRHGWNKGCYSSHPQ